MTHNWRPTALDEFVGQEDIIQELRDEILVANAINKPLTNRIFSGPPGLGKSTIVEAIAKETGKHVEVITGKATERDITLALSRATLSVRDHYWHNDNLPPIRNSFRTVQEKKEAEFNRNAKIGTIRNKDLANHPIVFMDEADALSRGILQSLHGMFEGPTHDGSARIFDGVNEKGRLQRFWVANITFYIATNYLGDLYRKDTALASRFADANEFQLYSDDQLVEIIKRFASDAGFKVNKDAANLIASRSRGVPRNATQYLKECETTYQAMRIRGNDVKSITLEIAEETFYKKGIDNNGLDKLCRAYLFVLEGTNYREKKSLASIADTMMTDQRTIEKVIEPYILSRGFAEKGSGGRFITDKGRNAIGIEVVNPMDLMRI